MDKHIVANTFSFLKSFVLLRNYIWTKHAIFCYKRPVKQPSGDKCNNERFDEMICQNGLKCCGPMSDCPSKFKCSRPMNSLVYYVCYDPTLNSGNYRVKCSKKINTR